MADNVRQMIAYGKLYPADIDQLDTMTATDADGDGDINALIVPYGSYKTALDCYKAGYAKIAGQHYDTVVIISPVHRTSFPSIALSSSAEWASPYSNFAVDKEAAEKLIKFRSEYINYNDKYFANESCAEIQLPFIYKTLGPNTKILPILIGENNTKFTIMLAKALASLLEDGITHDKKYLIIVTTNLSEKSKFEQAIVKDTSFVKIFSEMKPDRFSEQLALGAFIAHGGGGVTVLLRLAEIMQWHNPQVIKTYNTGDISGDKLEVDGYVAACL